MFNYASNMKPLTGVSVACSCAPVAILILKLTAAVYRQNSSACTSTVYNQFYFFFPPTCGPEFEVARNSTMLLATLISYHNVSQSYACAAAHNEIMKHTSLSCENSVWFDSSPVEFVAKNIKKWLDLQNKHQWCVMKVGFKWVHDVVH